VDSSLKWLVPNIVPDERPNLQSLYGERRRGHQESKVTHTILEVSFVINPKRITISDGVRTQFWHVVRPHLHTGIFGANRSGKEHHDAPCRHGAQYIPRHLCLQSQQLQTSVFERKFALFEDFRQVENKF